MTWSFPIPERIVSGGQAGADRGALDAAIALGIRHGGWCPRGRRAEGGPIPRRYRLTEHPTSDRYEDRTRANVSDADAVLLFLRGRVGPGSLLTLRLANEARKPLRVVRVDEGDGSFPTCAASVVSTFLERLAHEGRPVRTLMVAGSRESRAPGVAEATRRTLVEALRRRT